MHDPSDPNTALDMMDSPSPESERPSASEQGPASPRLVEHLLAHRHRPAGRGNWRATWGLWVLAVCCLGGLAQGAWFLAWLMLPTQARADTPYYISAGFIRRLAVGGVAVDPKVAVVDFASGFTATQDGGVLHVTASGGGGGVSIDAGTFLTPALATATYQPLLDAGSVGHTLLADGGIDLGNLAASLTAQLPILNDAGVIAGYWQGTSAYTTVGYADGGLNDGAPNMPVETVIHVDPTQFVWRDNTSSDLQLRTVGGNGAQPLGTSTGVGGGAVSTRGTVSTTNGTATGCVNFGIPDGVTEVVDIVLIANSVDGGGLNSASYHRECIVERTDGSAPTIISGGCATIGTDREDDTTWTGLGALTFDGGAAGANTAFGTVNVAAAAGQNVNWYCRARAEGLPALDAGF